ncbi:plasmid partitioning protein RepB C-terminal domain-containing protein [Bradyrhizobium sp. sBnM-33]|uniref:plasmid partitioning protein RepB C-terminal domain-containing protein n=1 Tax=Bradyrhizobium sp. sBnM-33 TaxID=2831780 RepID=UPI001BCC8B8D|nr:plasmid partitioning protein RepB C-terminal domain-containing protein [Bradyrhizobium sp. sBnM-33]WOH50678.1 plasmid partitioning protein RepB C-terminal domain-containing protein [Bradyrhizobium sp. sBnM-33]
MNGLINAQRHLKVIPIKTIRILNPRVRNRRNFNEIVESVAQVGLKRPITVSPRLSDVDEFEYDLVCGQGRIEAFVQLGQSEIPAMIIDAEESDCLVMSLVENCARRHHRAIDLLEDINTLRGRGYDDREIAEKIGVSLDYVRMISTLLAEGEERLVNAVEAGILPLNMAIEIAKSDDADVQRALTQAYSEKKLRGKKLVAVRRLLDQRQRRGKHLHSQSYGRRDGAKRPLTSESMIRIYRREADRQRLLVKKAEVTQSRLLFVVEAIRALRKDKDFTRLLQAEDLASMPSFLEERLAARMTP